MIFDLHLFPADGKRVVVDLNMFSLWLQSHHNTDQDRVVTKMFLTQFILNTSSFALQVQQCSDAREGEYIPLLDKPYQAHHEENVRCILTTDTLWYIFRFQALSDLSKDASNVRIRQ